MKLETSISSEFFNEIETLARSLGITRSELLRRALIAYVGTRKDAATGPTAATDGVRKTLDGIYSENSSDIDHVLAQMQMASLPKETW